MVIMKKTILTAICLFISTSFLLSQSQSVVVANASGATITDWGTRTFTQQVNLGFNPAHLAVLVNLNHTWVADLQLKVTNPQGNSAIVFKELGTNPCFGCDGNNMNITFRDGAAVTYAALNATCSNNPAYSGQARSLQSMNSLLTGSVNGNWTIEIKDYWPAETGVINNIALLFTGGTIIPEYAINQQSNQYLYADPVQLGTGTFTNNKSDLRIPVIEGNIEFSRYYNSLNNEVSGPLGYGWSHSYRYSLVNRQDTAWDVHYADGHMATFIPLDEFGNSFPLYSGTLDSLQKNSDLSYSLYTREKIRYQFDPSGKLDSIIDLNGNATVLYYNGAILDSIAGPGGRLIELGYTDDKITSVKDPLNRYIYYEYDENDNLIKVINANSDTSCFVYDDAHLLLTAFNNLGDTVVHNSYDPLTSKVISQKDGHQQLTIFEYDTPEVGATSVTNPDNSEIIVLHDAYYRKTNETNELGHDRSYEYDIHSNEIKTTNELGEQIKRLYDSRANMLSDTLPGNRITDVVYNQFNSPLQIIDANGNQKNLFYNTLTNNLDSIMLADSTKVRYTYDSLGQMTQMTDGKGNITNYTYSDFGDLLSIQTAAGTRHFTYDAAGRKLSETDENGHTTTYTYDLNNNVLVVIDPLGKTVESTYDANNQLLSIKDKNGSITFYSYDKKGRKVSSTDPLGGITSYAFDVRDNLITVTDPNNHVVSYTYDAANRKTSMTNALGTTQYTYDPAGNLIRVTDPDNRFTDYTYTPTNKKASMTDGMGNLTSYTYDNNDNLISMTDALNRTTVYGYDGLNRMVTVTDPLGNETSVSYDAAGNRLTVTDPNGHPISYSYDSANRLISSADAAGNVISYTLDNNGNITTLTKPTGTITKTYDALNRIITVVNSTGDNYTFTYDDNGNVLTMTNLSGTSEMEYDSLNRLTGYTDPNGKSVGFEYDDAGNKTSMVYPGNKTVNYTYDGANDLVTVTDWLGKVYTYSYDASGRIRELLYPNEIRCSYTYDQAGRLISRIYYDADSTVMSGSYFDLNPVGNRISEQKFGQQSGVAEDLSRVYAYTADDIMLSDSIWTYTHDLSGNRIAETDGTVNAGYTFTVDNLLTGRTNTNADVFSYTYNPLGNRLSVTEGTEVKRFVVDISTNLSKVLQITDENGEVIADYIYGLGLLGQIDSLDNPLYYHFDGQHNTIMLTDENAEIQDWYTYDPFGTVVTHTGTTEQPFTFLGEYGVEAEAPGLYYVRARYYDALNGRFLSKDAFEYDLNYPQTINRYVYGLNSPISNYDASGLFSEGMMTAALAQYARGTTEYISSFLAGKFAYVSSRAGFTEAAIIAGTASLYLANNAMKDFTAGNYNFINSFTPGNTIANAKMAHDSDIAGIPYVDELLNLQPAKDAVRAWIYGNAVGGLGNLLFSGNLSNIATATNHLGNLNNFASSAILSSLFNMIPDLYKIYKGIEPSIFNDKPKTNCNY